MLSGFLIGGILLDNRNAENFFRAFWTRRIARIFPVAYLLLATYAVALLVSSRFDLSQLKMSLLADPQPPFWTYATFMQSIPIALGGYGGPRWVGITWSLAIEEQFYMLFPFAVYFLSRRSLTAAAVAGIVMALMCRAVVGVNVNDYASYVLLPCRMDGLLFGVLVAVIVRNPRALVIARQLRFLLELAVLAIVLVIMSNVLVNYAAELRASEPYLSALVRNLYFSALALMFAILILRIFLYEDDIYKRVLRSDVLVKAGLISYATYMYHQAVNGLLHGFIFNQAPKVSSIGEAVIGIVVMVIALSLATLSFIFLERPSARGFDEIRCSPMLSEPR